MFLPHFFLRRLIKTIEAWCLTWKIWLISLYSCSMSQVLCTCVFWYFVSYVPLSLSSRFIKAFVRLCELSGTMKAVQSSATFLLISLLYVKQLQQGHALDISSGEDPLCGWERSEEKKISEYETSVLCRCSNAVLLWLRIVEHGVNLKCLNHTFSVSQGSDVTVIHSVLLQTSQDVFECANNFHCNQSNGFDCYLLSCLLIFNTAFTPANIHFK